MFTPLKFSWKYFHVVLARIVLVKLKRVTYIHGKTFTVLLKTVKVFSPVNFSTFMVYINCCWQEVPYQSI